MLPVQHCYCLSVPGGLPCPAFHSIFLKYFYSFFFSFSNMLKQQSSRFTAAGREFFCEICFVSRSCEPLFLTVRKPSVFVVRYNMLKKIKRGRIFADFFAIFFISPALPDTEPIFGDTLRPQLLALFCNLIFFRKKK